MPTQANAIQQNNRKFEALAAKLFKTVGVTAHNISLCGHSFVATFTGPDAAEKAAHAIAGALKGVRVWESLEDLKGAKVTIANRTTFKVWRVGGTI